MLDIRYIHRYAVLATGPGPNSGRGPVRARAVIGGVAGGNGGRRQQQRRQRWRGRPGCRRRGRVGQEAAAATRPRVAAPAAGRGGSSGTRDGQGALHTRARLRLPTSGEETMRNAERGVEDDVEEM